MKKLVRIVANKYFIVSAVFVLWVAFFDQNDWMTLRDRKQDLNTVKSNIAYLQTEIKTMSEEKKALVADANGNLNDPVKLEQYAREQYRMKQDNEDVYVIGE